jgi:transcriptional regulator with XRE-family HTH domain
MGAVLAEERFSSGSECDDVDRERRAELRSFLTKLRSDLRPQDVGLPCNSHRRVSGLRRQEVAELVGVSEDWYRWFESGRPISVSPRFIARLAKALRLNPSDEVGLYRLALHGLYRAERVAATLHRTASLVGAVGNSSTAAFEKARENRPEHKAADVGEISDFGRALWGDLPRTPDLQKEPESDQNYGGHVSDRNKYDKDQNRADLVARERH